MEKIASKNSLNLINGPQGCCYRMSTYTNELYFHTLAVNIVKMKLYIWNENYRIKRINAHEQI